MNLTSQYIVNPKVTKAYSNSESSYQSIQSTHSKMRLSTTRENLKPCIEKKKISFVVKKIVFRMISCPKGKFTMGSSDPKENNPRRRVSIDRPFLLGETEVTQELFLEVMGFEPSWYTDALYDMGIVVSRQRPVENITWYDAVMFCNKLSEILGKSPYYNISNIDFIDGEGIFGDNIRDAIVTINPQANGFRLPLETEWEYAAKAGTDDQWAGTNDPHTLGEFAWFRENSKINNKIQPHPVKGRRPNKWGFYDMSGNITEWCWDRYEDYGDYEDFHIIRGGRYGSKANEVCTYTRGRFEKSSRSETIGFRIAATVFD